MKPITGIVLVGLMLSCVAQAASFDCGKAKTKVEKLVCTDPALSKQDEAMQSAYQNAYKHTADPVGLKIEQRKWQEVRNTCKGTACLVTAYSTRLASLNEILAQPQPCFRLLERKWPAVQSGHYPVCVAYLKNLNSPLCPTLQLAHDKIDPAIKELSHPQWEKVDPKADLGLIKETLTWWNPYNPPNEEIWQILGPEILSRLARGEVTMEQTRIKLAKDDNPVLLVRIDFGRITEITGSSGAILAAGGGYIRAIDEHTRKINKRYEYLRGIDDVFLHEENVYLTDRPLGYGGKRLVVEEPFSVPETGGKGMTSVCVFENLKFK